MTSWRLGVRFSAVQRSGQILIECLVSGIFLAIVLPHVPTLAMEVGGYGLDVRTLDVQQSSLNRSIADTNDQFCSTVRRAIFNGVNLTVEQHDHKKRLCGIDTKDETTAINSSRKRAKENAIMSRAERNFRSHCAGMVSNEECDRLATLAGYQ